MRWTIGTKLGLGFAAVILLMLICAVVVYSALARLNTGIDRLTNNAVPMVRACDELLNGMNHSVAALRGLIILGDDPKQAMFFKDERQRAWKSIDSSMTKLLQLAVDSSLPENLRNLTPVQTNLDGLRKAQQDVEDTAEKDKAKTNELIETQSAPRAAQVRVAIEALKDAAARRMAEERTNIESASAIASTTLIGANFVAIGLAAIIAVALSRRISLALRELLTGVQNVAEGNLTGGALPIRSQDEIGDLAIGFNQMVQSLRKVLSEISTMTAEVVTSSRQISAGAQQQLAGLNQTATSLNEITTTAEQFKTTMQEFADRANAVKEAAVETSQRAKEGRSLTTDSAQRIAQVRDNSQAAGQSVLHLAEQMQRIGEITATVNEIAEQTKLLALNASIEAARAGENGRGFAVVATQVRELANESKQSAARIEALIGDTQKSMQDVAGRIQEGSRLSENSVDVVRRSSTSFADIAEAIDQTREAMVQINTATRQQEQGISELVSSITEIDSASKESLAAAEQTQRSIVAIDQRIQNLNTSIARFKT